jgi:hypothetical protein
MDRNIFKLNLPTEATSAYILVASLMEQDVRPTLDEIRSRWTTSDSDLDDALRELIRRRILKVSTSTDESPVYFPNPSNLWRK